MIINTETLDGDRPMATLMARHGRALAEAYAAEIDRELIEILSAPVLVPIAIQIHRRSGLALLRYQGTHRAPRPPRDAETWGVLAHPPATLRWWRIRRRAARVARLREAAEIERFVYAIRADNHQPGRWPVLPALMKSEVGEEDTHA